MKHLILIQSNRATADLFAGMSDVDRKVAFQTYWDVEADLEASGELVDSKAIAENAQKVVRRTADQVVASDAPPPEVIEVVSGYYLVDVADEARAIAIAARFPESAVGAIRVARTLTAEDFATDDPGRENATPLDPSADDA